MTRRAHTPVVCVCEDDDAVAPGSCSACRRGGGVFGVLERGSCAEARIWALRRVGAQRRRCCTGRGPSPRAILPHPQQRRPA